MCYPVLFRRTRWPSRSLLPSLGFLLFYLTPSVSELHTGFIVNSDAQSFWDCVDLFYIVDHIHSRILTSVAQRFKLGSIWRRLRMKWHAQVCHSMIRCRSASDVQYVPAILSIISGFELICRSKWVGLQLSLQEGAVSLSRVNDGKYCPLGKSGPCQNELNSKSESPEEMRTLWILSKKR